MTEREILKDMLSIAEISLLRVKNRVAYNEKSLAWLKDQLEIDKAQVVIATENRDKIKALIREITPKEKVTAELLQHHTYIDSNGELVVESVLHDILTEEQCKRALACVDDNITENEDGTFTVDYVQAEVDYYKEV